MHKIPKHVGIILDGNRRFAKRLLLQPWKGHELGAQKFRDFLRWCEEIGIDEVTAYCFSIQNFNRPKEELDYIMKLFGEELTSMLKPENVKLWKEKGLKYRVIGRLHLLTPKLQDLCQKIMAATKDNKPRCVNFAFAYGGREEIIDAVKAIAHDVKDGRIEAESITEETIGSHLWLNSNPDLIIRTGGEQRTSNFLPWQATYSELMFITKFWPELEKEDLLACVKEFSERERRFGK